MINVYQFSQKLTDYILDISEQIAKVEPKDDIDRGFLLGTETAYLGVVIKMSELMDLDIQEVKNKLAQAIFPSEEDNKVESDNGKTTTE